MQFFHLVVFSFGLNCLKLGKVHDAVSPAHLRSGSISLQPDHLRGYFVSFLSNSSRLKPAS
jgi:hypothetical protein